MNRLSILATFCAFNFCTSCSTLQVNDVSSNQTAIINIAALERAGSPESINNLGITYAKGDGVAQDYNQALTLFKLAANMDYPSAQYNLGNTFYFGQGVKMNNNEALY